MDFPPLGAYDLPINATGNMLMYNNASEDYSDEFGQEGADFQSEFDNSEFPHRRTIVADGSDRFGVSTVAFDLQEELIWMGNQGGHVTSYYGMNTEKYTSFQVHASQEIRDIHPLNDSILILTQNTLRCQLRRGIPIFTHSSTKMVEMHCMLQSSDTSILMGGLQENLIEFDLTRCKETRHCDVGEDGCAILRQHPRYLCAGTPTGQISLLDRTSLKTEHILNTHFASLSDFDVEGNLLITCGFHDRLSSLQVNRALTVYDLRILRAVDPIPLIVEPLLLKLIPSYSTRVVVLSGTGQMQLVDTVALSEPNMCVYQVNTGNAMCTSLDISSSCQGIVIGDGSGFIHLFGTKPDAVFNTYSHPTEFADPVEPLEPISFNDVLAPLAAIPMPLGENLLFSNWPPQYCKEVYRPNPPIPPEILHSMKMVGTVGYAPNTSGRRRNQIPYKLENKEANATAHDSLDKSTEHLPFPIPKEYRKLEIKYSKLGMEDFDFDRYNKTGFSGLEATLPNSYCNAMLQILYYIEPLRCILESHVCHKEFCLACELGFLFRMLDTSQGFPCHANNFLRAFRTIPEASALGLILQDQEDVIKKANLPRLIQSWNRFILQQIHSDTLTSKEQEKFVNGNSKEGPPEAWSWGDAAVGSESCLLKDANDTVKVTTEQDSSEPNEYSEMASSISKLLGIHQKNVNHCVRCHYETTKEATVLLCNMLYSDPEKSGKYDFCDLMRRSLCSEQTTQAWCDKCEKYQPTIQSRRLLSLSNILSLNCGLDNSQDLGYWQTLLTSGKDSNPQLDSRLLRPQGGQRPCRYGMKCTRIDCRFWHEGREKPLPKPRNTSVLYEQYPWLPLNITVALRNDGSVEVTYSDNSKLNDDLTKTEDSSTNEENKPDLESKTVNEKTANQTVQQITYELAAVVCHIQPSRPFERKNLVALINVGPSYHKRSMGSPVGQWYIFNDFSITPVNHEEAICFNPEWKVPCLVYYRNVDMPADVNLAVVNPVTAEVFSEDKSISQHASRCKGFTPISVDEIPGAGDLVAMDAEFVTLNQEVAELRSDGKLSTIKPSHMSVARITCIRGQGELEGTPFIDDYISTQEQIVDYLTKFSGIKPGDLDANYSSKHLTTLKATYLKLCYLIDSGVKFIGHGLKNDFRVINLVVPLDQVIDTVHLFHLPHQRMVSLRFLAWHFLGIKIQSQTHDSIEDARTALQLYRKYQDLVKENRIDGALEDLYRVGKRVMWKVPGVDD